MKWDKFSVVVREFGCESFSFKYLRQVVDSDFDDEAFDETSSFVGIHWTDVSPDLFRKNFSVFSYFSDFAFFLYTPALIRCSLEDAEKSHLAVETFLNCLGDKESKHIQNFYERRWRQFSIIHLNLLISWLADSGGDFLRFFDQSEIERSISHLNELVRRAHDVENRWRRLASVRGFIKGIPEGS